jgi:S-adenosylmethionine:tRNA ribosyltransferase-isomerase
MLTRDFDYHLPIERIAQTPLEPRHNSRLLVFNRHDNQILHSDFFRIGDYLSPGDVVVINQTRVIPARIFAHKTTGGRVEVLLLRRESECVWEAIIGGKKVRAGSRLEIEGGPGLEIIEVLDGARRLIRFEEPVEPFLNQIGQMPLPPYIHEPLQNPERYQTVFADQPGSAAAPTAGLHFTQELIEKLEYNGIRFVRVTLHVGLDTFAPVNEENPNDHKIHSEWCELTPEAAEMINTAKRGGKKVVAVGTTSVRTLESAARYATKPEIVTAYHGPTDLFILPGYEFTAVDAMITNFHLPRSTLLMLVSAFVGRERILEVYQEAIRRAYRFYSFGDAMLIL